MGFFDIAINTAVQGETLNNDACVNNFRRRRDLLAADTELLPEVRDRSLGHLDNVIATEIPEAINDGQPVVKILKREVLAIGNLHYENDFRLSILAEKGASPAIETSPSPQSKTEVRGEPEEKGGVEQGDDADAPPASAGPRSEKEVNKQPDEMEGVEQAQNEHNNSEPPEGDPDEADARTKEGSESDLEAHLEEEEKDDDPDYGKATPRGKGKAKTEAQVYVPVKSGKADVVRYPAALAARRRRRFFTHHLRTLYPRTNDKTFDHAPRLYDIFDKMPNVHRRASVSRDASPVPTDEAPDSEKTASPALVTPAKISPRKTAKSKPNPKSEPELEAIFADKAEEVVDPAPPVITPAAAARAARANRRASGMMRSVSDKRPATKPPSSNPAVHDTSPAPISKLAKHDASPNSLIVKFNVRKSIAPPSIPKLQPTINPKRGPAAVALPPALKSQPTVPPKPVPAKNGMTKVVLKHGRAVKSAEYVDTDTEEDAQYDAKECDAVHSVAVPKKRSGKFKSAEIVDKDTEIADPEEEEESDGEMLRKDAQRVPMHPGRRGAISALINDVPISLTRRGAIANPVPLLDVRGTISTTLDSAADYRETVSTVSASSDLSTPPKTPHKLVASSSSTYPAFPPFTHAMDIEPFYRGATIALENIQQDCENNDDMPLLEVIDNLNDTRPLVNNREHRTVMAGGSWVYSVLKPLAEKAEEQGEDLDIENVVSDTKTWVDGEYARVRR